VVGQVAKIGDATVKRWSPTARLWFIFLLAAQPSFSSPPGLTLWWRLFVYAPLWLIGNTLRIPVNLPLSPPIPDDVAPCLRLTLSRHFLSSQHRLGVLASFPSTHSPHVGYLRAGCVQSVLLIPALVVTL
jgi:hypothetical protein